MAFYGSGIFYNSGAKYVGPTSSAAQGIPLDLRFYRTSQDGIYVFWWGFDPAFISPSLFTAGFDLQLDTALPFTVTSITDTTHLVVVSTAGMLNGDTIFQVNDAGVFTTQITSVTNATHLVVGDTTRWVTGPASAITFTTPNLVTFTETSAITYQNGNVRKGFAVPVAAREEGIEQVWYARVRTHTPSFISAWSVTLTWTIPEKVQEQYAEALMGSLPDYHVYGKGDLLKPVDQRNSNLYTVENMYGNQLDAVFYENFLTQTDNYVDLCRDEFLQQNFGVLFNFPKPVTLQFVDYRWILMNLFLASLVGSTNEAIILTIQAFTGVPPIITDVRDEDDFFISTVQDSPIVPSGPQSVFFTSHPYIVTTLVVQDITTGLLVPSSAYTTNGVLGTWTMNVATTHTLQATFNINVFNPSDPDSIIFDALAGATLLTGSVTFTNGSSDIGGSGTLFLTQLAVGQQITDSNGIYLGEIDQITDNTHAHFLNAWLGPTEVSPAFRLLYTDIQLPPPILWDKSTLAWGIIVTILNPGQFVLS